MERRESVISRALHAGIHMPKGLHIHSPFSKSKGDEHDDQESDHIHDGDHQANDHATQHDTNDQHSASISYRDNHGDNNSITGEEHDKFDENDINSTLGDWSMDYDEEYGDDEDEYSINGVGNDADPDLNESNDFDNKMEVNESDTPRKKPSNSRFKHFSFLRGQKHAQHSFVFGEHGSAFSRVSKTFSRRASLSISSTSSHTKKRLPRSHSYPIGMIKLIIIEGSSIKSFEQENINLHDIQIRLFFEGIHVHSQNGPIQGGESPKWDVNDPTNTLALPVFRDFVKQDTISVELWEGKEKYIGGGNISSLSSFIDAPKEYSIELFDDKNQHAGILSMVVMFHKTTLTEKVEAQKNFLIEGLPHEIGEYLEAKKKSFMVFYEGTIQGFFSTYEYGSLDNWITLIYLCIPFFVLSIVSNIPLAIRQWFLFVPVGLYSYLYFPKFVGKVVTALVKTYILFDYPGGFKIDAIHIKPWIHGEHLHCLVYAQGLSIGNPPGFPLQDFVRCGRIMIEGKISFADLFDIANNQLKPCPLKKLPDFKYLAKLDIHHVEFDDLLIDYQVHEGTLNLPNVSESLAIGEAKNRGWMRGFYKKGDPMPNQLVVKILRAKGLRLVNDDGKKLLDPYVVVKLRKDQNTSSIQNLTRNPIYNEEFYFHATQCTAVLVVQVWNKDASGNDTLLGQWHMAMKWLLADPYNCWHEKGLYVAPDRKIHGWFPLMNKKWRGVGKHGKIEMELHWKYVPENELKGRNDVPALTAIEQMTMNSEEAGLRFADVKLLLDYAPVLFDIKRVTVRKLSLHMQDIFPGFVEKKDGTAKKEYININHVDFHSEFRPKDGDLGITTFQVVYQFIRGVSTKIIHAASTTQISGTVGKMAITSVNQVVGSWKHTVTGGVGRLKRIATPFKRGIAASFSKKD